MEFENIKVENISSTKRMITIDVTNENIGSNYIYGIIYHLWNNKFKEAMSLDDFIKSIYRLDIINADYHYKKNNRNLKYFYMFLDEFYTFKKEYNILRGNVYGYEKI